MEFHFCRLDINLENNSAQNIFISRISRLISNSSIFEGHTICVRIWVCYSQLDIFGAFWFILSCFCLFDLGSSCLHSFYLGYHCLILSILVLYCLYLFYLVYPCFILSILVLSCLYLFYLVFSFHPLFVFSCQPILLVSILVY